MFAILAKRAFIAVIGALALYGVLIALGYINRDGTTSYILIGVGASMGVLTTLNAVIFIIVGLPFWWIQRKRNHATNVPRRIVNTTAEVFLASVWVMNVLLLVMVFIATITTTTQVAFVGFLFGSTAERHVHLLIMTLVIMVAFGFGTVARGMLGHRIGWRNATWHGIQSGVVCGVLVYAGLVLAIFPWDWLADDREWTRNNPWSILVVISEFAIIMAGTSALMSKQVQDWPIESESIGPCLHRSPFVMWVKNLGLRWNIVRIWMSEADPAWVGPDDSWFRIRIRKGLRWNLKKERLPRYRNNSDWPLFP